MKRPDNTTMFIGHRFVAVPALALYVGIALLEITNGGFGWMSVMALVMSGWFVNCMKARSRYCAWQREWDACDPDAQPREAGPKPKAMRALAFAAGLVGLCILIGQQADPGGALMLLASFAVPGLLLALFLRGRGQRRQATPKDWIVAQAVSRPLPAPAVAEAYARLPDYCRPQSRKDHA